MLRVPESKKFENHWSNPLIVHLLCNSPPQPSPRHTHVYRKANILLYVWASYWFYWIKISAGVSPEHKTSLVRTLIQFGSLIKKYLWLPILNIHKNLFTLLLFPFSSLFYFSKVLSLVISFFFCCYKCKSLFMLLVSLLLRDIMKNDKLSNCIKSLKGFCCCLFASFLSFFLLLNDNKLAMVRFTYSL